MSLEHFDQNCPGCRPVVLVKGVKLPDSSPEMQAILALWEVTTPEEREAFHKVTCQNCYDRDVLLIVERIVDQFQIALRMIYGNQQHEKKQSWH